MPAGRRGPSRRMPSAACHPHRSVQRTPCCRGQFTGRLIPLCGLLGHALRDDLVERRELRVHCRRPRYRLGHVPGDLLFEALRRIGPVTGQAFVEHARQCVDVGRRVDRLALEPLGGHVRHRPQRAARRRQPDFPGSARQAEVDQVHEVAVGDQDVRRFDVAVDQPGGMRGVQRRRDLLDHLHREILRQRLFRLAEHGPEVAALDQPHIQIEPAVDLAETVDRHHMWVVESGGGLRFAPEPRLERRVGRHGRRKHLERDYSVGPGVEGPVDLAHSPSAYQLLQLIVAEWCRIHR